MKLQKVIKVGKSLAIKLPNEFVKAKNLKAGQSIFLKADSDTGMVWISTEEEYMSGITPEFKRWLDEFMDEHVKEIYPVRAKYYKFRVHNNFKGYAVATFF